MVPYAMRNIYPATNYLIMNISNVQEVHSREFRVFDEKGNLMSQRSIKVNEQLIGIGTDFYVTEWNRMLLVFNEKSIETGRMSLNEFTVKNVTGNNINLVRGSILRTFNKNLKQISQRNN
jgi:hypothetical protein